MTSNFALRWMQRLAKPTWIMSSYIAEGIPFAMVIWVAGTMFKDLGHSDTEITVSVASIGVVWSLKPLWAGFLDYFGSNKTIVIATELVMALLLLLIGGALQLDSYFTSVIVLLWLVALASATQDICVDGVYIHTLKHDEQARYIGVQSVGWNLGRIIAVSFTVWMAGYLQTEGGFEVRDAWSAVLVATGGLMVVLAGFHTFRLPVGGQAVSSSSRSVGDTWASFKESALSFCDKPALWGMLSFVLFFRSAEGLLLVEAPLFMQACVEEGGLQMSLQDKGLIDGTIATVSAIVGGLLGGLFISRYTVKRTLFLMALCVNIPNVCFLFLAYYVQQFGAPSFSIIAVSVGLEKFWYGFGFAGNMLYMMQQIAPGKFKTTHYAFATAVMNLVLVPTQMASGPLADSLGFLPYFWLVMVATIPSLLGAWFAPFPVDGAGPNTSSPGGDEDDARRWARRATAYALGALALFLYVDTLCIGWLGSATNGYLAVAIAAVLALGAVVKVVFIVQAIRWGRASLSPPAISLASAPVARSYLSNGRGAIIAGLTVLVLSIAAGVWTIQDLRAKDWPCLFGTADAACQASAPVVKADCKTEVVR